MKKLIFPMIVLGGFLLLGTSDAQATETVPSEKQIFETVYSDYVDTNNDGICDNYNGSQPGKGLGPGNGQGVGKGQGKGQGKGCGLKDGSGAGRNSGSGKQLRDGSGGKCTTPSK